MAKRKDKLVIWQNVKEVRAKPCGEKSPYWSWMEMTAAKEVDDIPAPEDPAYNAQLDSVLEALNNGAEDLMTAKERKAFHLVVRMGYNFPTAGKKMRLPRGAVQQLVIRAAKKLRILASIHL